MDERFVALTQTMTRKPGADLTVVKEVEAKLNLVLPEDYIRFITTYNGAEGFIGENYLQLWSIEDLPQDLYNRDDELYPGLIFFGSDGGGEGFAFDTRSSDLPIVMVPWIASIEDIRFMAASFLGFLENLEKTPIWEHL